MPILKCESCGADLDFAPNAEIASCLYCGRNNTRPRVLDDQRTNAFNRANGYRANNDYDAAAGVFSNLVSLDDSEHKAYWGLVLSKYGIKYVEEGSRRIPTFNRLSCDPILAHPDYKSALEHADPASRAQYEENAAELAEIQKDTLSIAQKETAGDVFICYKESDATGHRTYESEEAYTIYNLLHNEYKFNVFFARTSLKRGTNYEPQIFSALNSAKVMVVITHNLSHINAPWVKNEWSRYLALQKKDPTRKLIVCYRDIRPEDLPVELGLIQCLNLKELTAKDDLLATIRQAIPLKQDEADTEARELSPKIANLLALGDQFLHNRAYDKAKIRYNQVVETDHKSARAYIGLMLAELRLPNLDGLIKLEKNWQKSEPNTDYADNWSFALTHAAPDYKKQLETILEKRSQYYLGEKVNEGYKLLKNKDFSAAYTCFKQIINNGYKSARAYIDLMLAEYSSSNLDELIQASTPWMHENIFLAVLEEVAAEYKTRLQTIVEQRENWLRTEVAAAGYAALAAHRFSEARAIFQLVHDEKVATARSIPGAIMAACEVPSLDDLVEYKKPWRKYGDLDAAQRMADSVGDGEYSAQLQDIDARRKNWLGTKVVNMGYAALNKRNFPEARDRFKFVHDEDGETCSSIVGKIMAECEVFEFENLVQHEEDWPSRYREDLCRARELGNKNFGTDLDNILRRREQFFKGEKLDQAFGKLRWGIKFDEANEIFDLVIKNNYGCPRAYLGKLLAKHHCSKPFHLAMKQADWTESSDFKNAMRYPEDEWRCDLEKFARHYRFIIKLNPIIRALYLQLYVPRYSMGKFSIIILIVTIVLPIVFGILGVLVSLITR